MTSKPEQRTSLLALMSQTTEIDRLDLLIAGGFIADAFAQVPTEHRQKAIAMLESYMDPAETEISDATKLIAGTVLQCLDNPGFVFEFIANLT